jgi:type II secretory pathway component PulF
MAISTVVGLRFGLIPSLAEQGLKSEDPLKTANFQRSIEIATLANDVLLAGTVLMVIAGVVMAVAYLGPDEKFRRKIDAMVMKAPIISKALLHAGMATTTKIMASLLKGGVTFLNAVTITAQGTRIPMVVAFWSSIKRRAENGEQVAMAFSHELLSGSERMILRSHADQEQLAHTMDIVSGNRDEMARRASKQFAIIAFVVSLIYSGIAVLFALWVVYLQNETVMTGGS